jgi:uncharacterized protein HemX
MAMAQAQVPGKSASARTRKSTTQTKQRTTTKKAPAKRASASPRKSAASTAKGDQRHAMIAEIAFYYAEQRGFQGDMAMDDWLRAEAEVDARLAGKRRTKTG